MIVLETNLGNIKIELNDNTPITSENFRRYVEEGFYNGVIFHRVIDGFMVQGGGFTKEMVQKDTHETITNEADLGGKNNRGTLAMARTGEPHSASAQFFINVVDNNFLNHKEKSMDGWGYCVFGEVTEGMDIVDKIKETPTTMREGYQDVPVEDVIITKAYIE
ncbi:MAG: peptidyl-prolyl cis-trans isomerase [Gammaproteobacteria bacterium]|nr:peptidyl-prolyl cis-trans isomerase [Gammaproteobacteria bacterium]